MSNEWILAAVELIKTERIAHRSYTRAVGDIFNALAVAQAGELVVVVGPSRVGKSRAITEAIKSAVGSHARSETMRPYVVIQAENASTQGTFSTKSFMRAACEAVRHPIYGVALESDQWRERLDARINRTPEGMLRDAFEHALRILKTRFVVVDEAHHVAYVGTFANAAAVLDSWKCLADKTNVVLCLVGSYKLLEIIAEAPHLLGRQRPIEFPRYRLENPEDLIAFEQLLETWSRPIRFERGQSLRTWNQYLFTHSFGCAGQLSMWLRSALGFANSRQQEVLSEEAFRATRLPAHQEEKIAEEILRGEQSIGAQERRGGPEGAGILTTDGGHLRRQRKPFQRTTRRFKRNGRA